MVRCREFDLAMIGEAIEFAAQTRKDSMISVLLGLMLDTNRFLFKCNYSIAAARRVVKLTSRQKLLALSPNWPLARVMICTATGVETVKNMLDIIDCCAHLIVALRKDLKQQEVLPRRDFLLYLLYRLNASELPPVPDYYWTMHRWARFAWYNCLNDAKQRAWIARHLEEISSEMSNEERVKLLTFTDAPHAFSAADAETQFAQFTGDPVLVHAAMRERAAEIAELDRKESKRAAQATAEVRGNVSRVTHFPAIESLWEQIAELNERLNSAPPHSEKPKSPILENIASFMMSRSDDNISAPTHSSPVKLPAKSNSAGTKRRRPRANILKIDSKFAAKVGTRTRSAKRKASVSARKFIASVTKSK